MGGKRVVDYSGMLKTLKDNPNYKSEAAKKAIEITEKMNKIHGLDHTLADAFKAPKDPKLQQGFSHNVAVRYLTMAANRAVQNTVKFLPFLQMGKTAASRHAIYNAVMSSSSARELGEKLSKAAMNKDIPVSEKIDIIEMAKAQFKFSNELDKAKADGIVKEATTKQENNVIKKGEAPGQHPGANFANESAPMAKDSQGLAFSPYKDDAQRVAQTNNDIILQNSAKGGAAEQGSKLEQAEVKQEVVKGEAKNQQFNNTNVDYTSAVKNIVERKELALRLDPKADILSVVKDFSKPIKTPIFTSKISVDKMLNHLADKIDGDRRLEYINLVKPTLEKPLFITQESINGAQRFRFFKTFIDEKDKVVKFLNVVEDKNGELIEITATPIKNTDLKNLLKGKVIWGGDTLSDLSTPQTAKQGSEADKAIISQNPADRLVEKIIELDDAGKIGDILRKTIISKDISTKTKLAAINAAKRRLVAITAKNTQKDDKKQK